MDLTLQELQDLTRLAKRQLRRQRRALRAAIPASARAARSRAITARLSSLPEVGQACAVALFWPIEDRGEVDLRGLDAALRARGARLYYPTEGGQGGTPQLAALESESQLSDEGRGFLEPPQGAPTAGPEDLDVIVVPALAVSETGHRLGYGAGFYDSLLPRFRPKALTIVVAYDFELLAELPVDEWDVPCDVVVTDARVLRPAAR